MIFRCLVGCFVDYLLRGGFVVLAGFIRLCSSRFTRPRSEIG